MLIALDSLQPEVVHLPFLQSLYGGGGGVALHFGCGGVVDAVLRHLHHNLVGPLFGVFPSQHHRGGVFQCGGHGLRIHDVVALVGQAVHVVFYVCIPVAVGIAVGVGLVRVGAVGLFPFVGHAVAVRVGRGVGSCQRAYSPNVLLVGDERALGAERGELFYYAQVVAVSHPRRPGVLHHGIECVFGRLEVHRRLALQVGLLHGRCPVVVGYQSAVELAVAVVVGIVAGAVQVVSLCPLVEILVRRAAARARDEVVVHHVLVVVGRRVASHDADAIVVHHVVIVLQVALHLRVSALVVGPQAVRYGPVARSVGNGPKPLRLYSLTDDAVLVSYVVRVLDVNVVPPSPRNGAVVEYYVVAVVHGQRAFVFRHAYAAPHPDVPHYHVRAVRHYHASAVDGYPLSRRGLPGYGQVAGNGQVLPCDVYHSADIEHNRAVGLAHGVGQRARPRCVEVGHVYHCSSSSACGIGPESFGAGECQLLRIGLGTHHECRQH